MRCSWWDTEGPHQADRDDQVGLGSSRGDQVGVAFVGAGGPGRCRGGFLAEPDVAGDEPAQALVGVEVDVPDFVELGPDLVPTVVAEEQVVAFGDDQSGR